jgi:hypothetical protein
LNDLRENLDQQRWLMNNGLFSDSSKNSLYLYGALAHKLVTEVELSVDPQNRVVSYILYAKRRLLKVISAYCIFTVCCIFAPSLRQLRASSVAF